MNMAFKSPTEIRSLVKEKSANDLSLLTQKRELYSACNLHADKLRLHRPIGYFISLVIQLSTLVHFALLTMFPWSSLSVNVN